MKTASAKAKGRRLQQDVATQIINRMKLTEDDVKSLPMGAHGPDIWLSSAAIDKFPWSVECKNVEKLNIQQAFKQCVAGCDKFNKLGLKSPLLVHSRNYGEILATVRLSDFLHLCARLDELESPTKI